MNDLDVRSERVTVVLINPDGDPAMIAVTQDQLNLLKWLEDEGWLADDIVLSTVPPMQII